RASIGTRLGTATVQQPAASAEATPLGESSSATQCRGSAPSSEAAFRYGSGSGFPRVTSSAQTVAVKLTPSLVRTASMIGRSEEATTGWGTRAAGTPAT